MNSRCQPIIISCISLHLIFSSPSGTRVCLEYYFSPHRAYILFYVFPYLYQFRWFLKYWSICQSFSSLIHSLFLSFIVEFKMLFHVVLWLIFKFPTFFFSLGIFTMYILSSCSRWFISSDSSLLNCSVYCEVFVSVFLIVLAFLTDFMFSC